MMMLMSTSTRIFQPRLNVRTHAWRPLTCLSSTRKSLQKPFHMASDEEFPASSSDVALPKATVNKFANEIAASLEVRLTADTRELIAECCTEFVQLLSSEANEICEKDKKKTITPEHVLRALQQLGLDRFHADVKEEYEKAKCDDKLKSRGASKRERQKARASADDEELLRQQEQLFAMARSDPMASNHPPE